MIKTLHLPVAALAIAFAATSVHAITVDEAYAAVQAKRFAFDAKVSTAKGDTEGLQRLFAIMDQGVVLRADTLRVAAAEDPAEFKKILARYDALIASLQKEKPSEALDPVREKVVGALQDQRKFLGSRVESGKVLHSEYRASAEIREARTLLSRGYKTLMDTFPAEPRKNKSAFQSYFSALDYY